MFSLEMQSFNEMPKSNSLAFNFTQEDISVKELKGNENFQVPSTKMVGPRTMRKTA